MRTDHALADSHFVSHLAVLRNRSQPLDPHVPTDLAAPRNDRVRNVGEIPHCRVSDYAAVSQPDALSDLAAWPHRHIWADFAFGAHLRSFVDKHISVGILRVRVDFVVVQKGTLGTQIVQRLPNVIPEVILYRQRVELSLLSHLRVDLRLNHAEPLRHAVED